MNNDGSAKAAIGKRLAEELREFGIIAAYFLVFFSALLYLKASILQAHGIPFEPFGFAVAKALICAKFVSLGRMLHIGERFKNLPLIWPTLHKSVAFLVFLLALNALEEIIVGLLHRRSIADSISAIGGGTLNQLIATSIIGLLILIPFFAFRTLGEAVGERNLVRAFFVPRHKVNRDFASHQA